MSLLADQTLRGRFRMRLRGTPIVFGGSLDVDSDSGSKGPSAKALFIGPIMIGFLHPRKRKEL